MSIGRYELVAESETLLPGQSGGDAGTLDAAATLRPNPVMFAEFDRERRRIEAALHDGVQQDLAATAVVLQLALQALESDPAEARKLLDELKADVESALERVRALAGTIYPSTLAAYGLANALPGIEAGPLGRYPLEIEEAVYFACSALLTETAQVRLWEGDGALRFEVVGAADESAVTYARARITAVGGQLRVSRGGTDVAAAVPVSSAR